MLMLMFPSNVNMFYGSLLPVICWDMFDGILDWEWKGIFRVTEEETAPFPG